MHHVGQCIPHNRTSLWLFIVSMNSRKSCLSLMRNSILWQSDLYLGNWRSLSLSNLQAEVALSTQVSDQGCEYLLDNGALVWQPPSVLVCSSWGKKPSIWQCMWCLVGCQWQYTSNCQPGNSMGCALPRLQFLEVWAPSCQVYVVVVLQP